MTRLATARKTCEARGRLRLGGLSLLGALLVASCTVGPDFVRPRPPAEKRYTHSSDPLQTVSADGQTQHFTAGAKIADDWWRLFQSPPLQAVIEEAMAENLDVKAAHARLRQSEDNLRAGYGTFFPRLDGSFVAGRQKFSPTRFGSSNASSIFNLYTATTGITYVLDVFGGQRRAVENLAAQVDYQTYTTQATYLTLLGNVINASIAQAAYRAEIEATQHIIGIENEQLRITAAQVRAGTVPYANVLSVRAQLASTEATLPPLKQNLSRTEHLLAALAGRSAAQWRPPTVELADFVLPVDLPLTLPSELARRRPDILAAEAQLHSASANIGVATAAMFPSLTLSATYGQNSTTITNLLAGAGNFWTMGAGLAMPVLQGGTLWFQRRAAIAAYQASLFDYRQVVVSALQQVADTLRALEHDAEAVRAQSTALATARQTLQLITASYRAGLVDYLQVLVSDSQYQQARLGHIQATALRLQDTAALFLALGGGWWADEGETSAGY